MAPIKYRIYKNKHGKWSVYRGNRSFGCYTRWETAWFTAFGTLPYAR